MKAIRQATGGALAMLTAAVLLSVLACAGLSALSGHTITVGDGQSLVAMHNPVQEAQATRVALAAADEASARELERQAVEAARPALALRNTLAALGVGAGALVLTVGLAFAAVAWVGKHASAVYPNGAGLYPVIVRRTWNGVTIMHDPNRALGPTTVYQVPTWLDRLARGRAGDSPLRVSFPQPGSEAAVVQITGQAQVAQIAAAQNRWPRLPPVAGRMTVHEGERMPPAPTTRMPAVRVIQDPEQIADFEHKLLEGGGK
ncbi:MAG: hypothetical protein JW850_15610 [Thermoflexales bacterium]|nr:hypothetical protein [Thermoflexales bacterium]